MAGFAGRDGCLSRPAVAKRVRDAEQEDFGDNNTLDEQEGAIRAEDAQRAFNLAPPVNRQDRGDGFDEPKFLVRSCREEGGVPPPGPDDNQGGTNKRSAFENAVAGRFGNERHVSVHGWSTPIFERMLVNAGIRLFKYYLDIDRDEQKKRLKERRHDPLSQWKISPIDKVALKHWAD